MSKQSLDFSSNLSASKVATYLEDLARCLRTGHIHLDTARDQVDMPVGDEVSLDLEARSTGKGRTSLELKLDWRKRKRSLDEAPGLAIRDFAEPIVVVVPADADDVLVDGSEPQPAASQ